MSLVITKTIDDHDSSKINRILSPEWIFLVNTIVSILRIKTSRTSVLVLHQNPDFIWEDSLMMKVVSLDQQKEASCFLVPTAT